MDMDWTHLTKKGIISLAKPFNGHHKGERKGGEQGCHREMFFKKKQTLVEHNPTTMIKGHRKVEKNCPWRMLHRKVIKA